MVTSIFWERGHYQIEANWRRGFLFLQVLVILLNILLNSLVADPKVLPVDSSMRLDHVTNIELIVLYVEVVLDDRVDLVPKGCILDLSSKPLVIPHVIDLILVPIQLVKKRHIIQLLLKCEQAMLGEQSSVQYLSVLKPNQGLLVVLFSPNKVSELVLVFYLLLVLLPALNLHPLHF